MPSDLVLRRRGGRGVYKSSGLALPNSGSKGKAKKNTLPEYLDAPEIEAIIRVAGLHPSKQMSRLLFLLQWRAGLRVSEALALRPVDVDFTNRQLVVRNGKGGKDRTVPLHRELAEALTGAIGYTKIPQDRAIIGVTRQAAWQWLKATVAQCVEQGTIAPGRKIGTHTLRHSACRHWLASRVPINVVQLWMGHSNLQTTAIYLRLIADPGGHMETVP